MGSLRDDRDDSDNDEMEHESADSDKSSTTSDSSDASDSDDSSELDGEECEKRRVELLETISDLERQFSILREQLYKERIAQIKRKLEDVQDGEAEEYRQPLQELRDNMRIRIEVAGKLRQLRLDNIDNSYEAESRAAEQNLEQNEKELLYDSMKEELEEKIRRLEEEGTVDVGEWGGEEGRGRTQTKTKPAAPQQKKGRPEPAPPSRRKPVTVTYPYIVYMLTDEDILEDWSLIRKSLTAKRNTDRLFT